ILKQPKHIKSLQSLGAIIIRLPILDGALDLIITQLHMDCAVCQRRKYLVRNWEGRASSSETWCQPLAISLKGCRHLHCSERTVVVHRNPMPMVAIVLCAVPDHMSRKKFSVI